MAENKSPAILFYTGDFLNGCSDLTMLERGQYITLLCLQHQKGHLSQKNITLSVGDVSPDVLAKFKVDADGLYYNERMDIEMEKRSKFVSSRKENGKKKWEKEMHMQENTDAYADASTMHMDMHMGNENRNINDNINNTVIDSNNKIVKHKYGEFNNVLLTDIEYEKLKEKYPFNYQKRIDDLSIYISSKGDKYKSHYHTILAWDRRNNEGNENSTFDADDFFEAAIKRSYEGEE